MTDRKPSMLEVHSQALEKVDELYHEFLLIYKKQAQCVYGFVEGKDDTTFYQYLIERQLPQGWTVKLIPSGNKQKVLRSFQSFTWSEYSRKRICFFMDRDLQDFLGLPQKLESNLYITDGYSIENSILQDELLFGVLSDIYQIRQLRPEEEEAIKQVIRKNENRFVEAIMPLMGQILLWRRRGDKANLNNLKLDDIFWFSEKAILVSKARKELLEIAAKQIGCNLGDESDIAEAETEVRSQINCRNLIRGKYAFRFFVKQCEAIWEAIPSLLTRFATKPKKRIAYGVNNAIIIFAPRARAPESLRDFVERNYLSFIREGDGGDGAEHR